MLDTMVSEGSSTLQKRDLPGEAHRGKSCLLLGAGHALSSPLETRQGAALRTGLGRAGEPLPDTPEKRGFPPDPVTEVNHPEETGGRQHNVILLPPVI